VPERLHAVRPLDRHTARSLTTPSATRLASSGRWSPEEFLRTLIDAEITARDESSALNRGGPLPETSYQAALTAFEQQGLAEIVSIVGRFSVVGVTLKAFDASVQGREEHLD
jgi:hypothetical protein